MAQMHCYELPCEYMSWTIFIAGLIVGFGLGVIYWSLKR